ncbi:MAG: DUF6515 family protein [Nitrospirota bacterium]
MVTRLKTTLSFVTISFLILSVMTALYPDDLFAARRNAARNDSPRVTRERDRRDHEVRSVIRHRERRHVVSPRFVRERHAVRDLPRGYKRYWHSNLPYFFFGGIFYRPAPLGFIPVLPPLGIIVDSIPAGYIRIWAGGIEFYSYGGVYYRRVPDGYVVVEAPRDYGVPEDAPDITAPTEPAEGKASVTTEILNVRTGPGPDYPLIYQIHKGYVLDIHGKSDGWLYVELPNGEFGWVMSEFTILLEEPGSG